MLMFSRIIQVPYDFLPFLEANEEGEGRAMNESRIVVDEVNFGSQ